jgi:hypothetical protein
MILKRKEEIVLNSGLDPESMVFLVSRFRGNARRGKPRGIYPLGLKLNSPSDTRDKERRIHMRIMLTAIFLTAALTGCAYIKTLPPEQLVVNKIIEAPGMSKAQLFERSKIWLAKTFRQPTSGFAEDNWRRTVIQYENESKGILIANAAILYPYRNFSGDTYKEGWEVRFTLAAEVMDGKARISFSDLTMYVPPHICGYAYPQVTGSYQKELTSEDMDKVRPIFDSFPDKLGAFLTGPEMRGEW